MGDACDPAPTTPGDGNYLYTFAAGTLGDLVSNGEVMKAGDAIVIGDAQNNLPTSLFTNRSFTRSHIELAYEVLAVGIGLGAEGNFEELEVFTARTGALAGWGCATERFDQDNSNAILYIETPMGQAQSPMATGGLRSGAGSFTVVQTEAMHCANTVDGFTINVDSANAPQPAPVGFYAIQLAARIDYFYVAGAIQ